MKRDTDKTTIEGSVFYLDKANVDTDQIIPAEHLTGVSITGLGQFLFEGVPGFNREAFSFQDRVILVTRENFGCGSSREHAVWALEGHGFRVVIAPSFARIFRQNMFNRGLLAIEFPLEEVDKMFEQTWQFAQVDLERMTLRFKLCKGVYTKPRAFQLSAFDRELVLQGGLTGFTAERY